MPSADTLIRDACLIQLNTNKMSAKYTKWPSCLARGQRYCVGPNATKTMPYADAARS